MILHLRRDGITPLAVAGVTFCYLETRHPMWPLGGEPHDTSALALFCMQNYSRYLSTFGILQRKLTRRLICST